MLMFRSAAVTAWTGSALKVQVLQQQCGRTDPTLQQPQRAHILTLGHDHDLSDSDIQLLLGLKVGKLSEHTTMTQLQQHHISSC
jgi:hypothetical protein